MNFYRIRHEFDLIVRTLGDSTFERERDNILNDAWRLISILFEIPALKATYTQDIKEDEDEYLLPLDWGETEISVYYKLGGESRGRRLDPIMQEQLDLAYEYRAVGGMPRFYDRCGVVGSDLAVVECNATNNSNIISSSSTLDDSYINHWICFDPVSVGSRVIDISIASYLITNIEGDTMILNKPYRGPSGDVIGRIRPAHQGKIKIYACPVESREDGLEINYYANPHILYNDEDVPEWANAGLAIVCMGVSLCYDYLHQPEMSDRWFKRAVSKLSSLKRRMDRKQILVPDLTVGSIAGRRTGLWSITGGDIYFRR